MPQGNENAPIRLRPLPTSWQKDRIKQLQVACAPTQGRAIGAWLLQPTWINSGDRRDCAVLTETPMFCSPERALLVVRHGERESETAERSYQLGRRLRSFPSRRLALPQTISTHQLAPAVSRQTLLLFLSPSRPPPPSLPPRPPRLVQKPWPFRRSPVRKASAGPTS